MWDWIQKRRQNKIRGDWIYLRSDWLQVRWDWINMRRNWIKIRSDWIEIIWERTHMVRMAEFSTIWATVNECFRRVVKFFSTSISIYFYFWFSHFGESVKCYQYFFVCRVTSKFKLKLAKPHIFLCKKKKNRSTSFHSNR